LRKSEAIACGNSLEPGFDGSKGNGSICPPSLWSKTDS
jgi:hypothetical protein